LNFPIPSFYAAGTGKAVMDDWMAATMATMDSDSGLV